MELRKKRLLICDCEGTLPLSEAGLTRACEAVGASGDLEINTQLCRAQLENYQRALAGEEPLLVACTQEAPFFSEVAAEASTETLPAFANIRERAGWSDQATAATAKIAALLAEASLDIEPTPATTLTSSGVCLVYGRDERAIEAAKQLSSRLEVTVLLSESRDLLPPRIMDVPIFKGTITAARGHLGKFAVSLRDYAPATPSSKTTLTFDAPRAEAYTECELILDLSGGTPLFQAADRRDGYYRPDPDDPAAVQRALFELSDMVGEFEKPLYVRYEGGLCAHSRSRQAGCTRCLDVCPTGAITSSGDVVAIDPFVCGGCGACASVCPTGAATYQLPAGMSLFERLRVLLAAYRSAGGELPLLFLHDNRHGDEMIALMARLGRGLPADVLPFAVNEVTQVGLDFFAAALGYGASGIAILVDPRKRHELEGLAREIGLAETVMAGLGYGGNRIWICDDHDPTVVEARLHDAPRQPPAPAGSFLLIGQKRARSLLALKHLHDQAPSPVDHLPLPQGAPFGTIRVETEGCTLCLACVGACPTGALLDDPDRPWLGMREDACVQCGICRNTCPEKVIALEPRINFTEAAFGAVELNRAEPFHCIRCGKPFGAEVTIERIAEQLAGRHAMFENSDQIELIMMCDDCRVVVQFDDPKTPLAGAPRPIPRTTDDYLREREIEEARAKLKAERKNDEG